MLKKCARCGLPETYETIEFDEFGVCNICIQFEYRESGIDWTARRKMLDELIEPHRGGADYDCIVPFSGGKDSTFTLWFIVKELGLKPLVVQFNHGFMRPNLLQNNERTFKKLGVDVLSFTPNWHVVRLLMKESLLRKGDFCWHCHTGIFSYPMHIAIKFKVPLIFWGEASSEYTAYYKYSSDQIEKVDQLRFNRFVNLGLTAEDMEKILQDEHSLDRRSFLPYSYPRVEDLESLGCESVTLGSFIPWDTQRQYELISSELGWEGDQVEGMPRDQYPYEKIECFMQGSRDYLKFLKRGYSRVTQMTALDLRRGRMDKDTAEELIADYEGKRPASLDLLLEYVGMTEEELNEVISTMAVFPHKPFFESISIGPPTDDFASWYRDKSK